MIHNFRFQIYIYACYGDAITKWINLMSVNFKLKRCFSSEYGATISFHASLIWWMFNLSVTLDSDFFTTFLPFFESSFESSLFCLFDFFLKINLVLSKGLFKIIVVVIKIVKSILFTFWAFLLWIFLFFTKSKKSLNMFSLKHFNTFL